MKQTGMGINRCYSRPADLEMPVGNGMHYAATSATYIIESDGSFYRISEKDINEVFEFSGGGGRVAIHPDQTTEVEFEVEFVTIKALVAIRTVVRQRSIDTVTISETSGLSWTRLLSASEAELYVSGIISGKGLLNPRYLQWQEELTADNVPEPLRSFSTRLENDDTKLTLSRLREVVGDGMDGNLLAIGFTWDAEKNEFIFEKVTPDTGDRVEGLLFESVAPPFEFPSDRYYSSWITTNLEDVLETDEPAVHRVSVEVKFGLPTAARFDYHRLAIPFFCEDGRQGLFCVFAPTET